jgi:uncharacterized protein (DUF1697 family)
VRGVALLRGINVGGRARVAMAELREVFERLDLTDVATYLTSGNVVFSAPSIAEGRLVPRLEKEIEGTLGVACKVLLRKTSELADVAREHPFSADEPVQAKLHVVFLREVPSAAAAKRLDPNRSPGDRYALRGRELYIHYPNGQGRSKLTVDYVERQLGTVGTARNWNTVVKLNEIAGDR